MGPAGSGALSSRDSQGCVQQACMGVQQVNMGVQQEAWVYAAGMHGCAAGSMGVQQVNMGVRSR